MELLDVMQRYWALAFVASAVSSVATSTEGTPREKAKRVVMVVALVLAALRLERELSERVFTPLLKWMLGDNEEMRREVEAMEAEAKRRLEEMKRGGSSSANANAP